VTLEDRKRRSNYSWSLNRLPQEHYRLYDIRKLGNQFVLSYHQGWRSLYYSEVHVAAVGSLAGKYRTESALFVPLT
jgi:hypothetical protein